MSGASQVFSYIGSRKMMELARGRRAFKLAANWLMVVESGPSAFNRGTTMYARRMKPALVSVCWSALLLSCSPARPEPSVCDLAQFPKGWVGADVRVTGLALGEAHHGFVLVSKSCYQAIHLEITDKTLLWKLDEANKHGLVSVDVSGKFIARDDPMLSALSGYKGALWVNTVHSFRLMPMEDRAGNAYWNALLQRRVATPEQ